jgi:uncharacterized membrane protein (UPF0182 family)
VLWNIARAGVAVTGGLILLSVGAGMVVDWLWFADLGYLGVFWVRLATKASIFFAVLILVAGLVWLNGWLALRGRKAAWALAVAPKLPWSILAHGSALLGAFFLVKAWSYGLDRYLLLYRDNGVVVGASYTDLHVELPVLGLLIALALLASLLSL